jgi:hypothetical protein
VNDNQERTARDRGWTPTIEMTAYDSGMI